MLQFNTFAKLGVIAGAISFKSLELIWSKPGSEFIRSITSVSVTIGILNSGEFSGWKQSAHLADSTYLQQKYILFHFFPID